MLWVSSKNTHRNMFPSLLLKCVLAVFVLLSVVVRAHFPYYDLVHFAGTIGAYAYFDYNHPIWVKIAWWGSFAQSLSSTTDQALEVCKACVGNHESPNWDCGQEINRLSTALAMNTITLAVGWNRALPWQGAIEGQDDHLARRWLNITHDNLSADYYNYMSQWISDHYNSNASFPRYTAITDPGVVKRDISEDGTVYVEIRDNVDDRQYRVGFNPSSQGSGAVKITDTTSQLGNETSAGFNKRQYTHYAPLCHGYLASDYCVNKNGFAGFYSSGDLQWELQQLFDNDEYGTWKSDYYKMYTYQQDGVTQDWQLSFKQYYVADDNAQIWYTHCDTGY